MKFSEGDNIYNGLVETAGHEFLVATESYKSFNRSIEIVKDIQENNLINAMCYQHYSEFIRSLYEYYIAIIQWNEKNTRLREYDFDSKMTEAVQRLLNFYGPVRRPTNPEFPEVAPKNFGRYFRQIRNRVAHADYRRMAPELGNDEVTLAEFYTDYHFYCVLLVEHPQLTWGGEHFVKSYTWKPVSDFMNAVRKNNL